MNERTSDPEVPAATALDLTGLVDYAEGSVVSRTIMDNDAGTLTLFAFDAGQALSEHTAPFHAFVQVLDGEAEFTVGGKAIRAGRGQLVVMPADVPHAARARGRFKMLLVMIRPDEQE